MRFTARSRFHSPGALPPHSLSDPEWRTSRLTLRDDHNGRPLRVSISTRLRFVARAGPVDRPRPRRGRPASDRGP
jgi:hypothetical protein